LPIRLGGNFWGFVRSAHNLNIEPETNPINKTSLRFVSAIPLKALHRVNAKADYGDMVWRTLGWKVTALLPWIAVAALAFVARTYQDPREPIATDLVQQARILSYRSIVAKTAFELARNPDIATTEALVAQWRRATDGRNGHLIPVAVDDTAAEGAKNEILVAQLAAVRRLQVFGLREARKGHVAEALALYRESLQEDERLKYLDPDSLRLAIVDQRRTMYLMASAPLSAAQRSDTIAFLSKFSEHQPSLAVMDMNMMSCYTESQVAEGQAELVWTEHSLHVNLASLPSENTAKGRARHILGATGSPYILSRLRMTHFAVARFNESVHDTINQLRV